MTHQVLRTLSTHGVVAAGITAPSAAPPPFQLSHDGALAAPLGATAGQMPAYRGRWHLSSIIFQVSLWGWGLRLQDRTGPGMFLPPRVFPLIVESLLNLNPKYGLMNILILVCYLPTPLRSHSTICLSPHRQSLVQQAFRPCAWSPLTRQSP